VKVNRNQVLGMLLLAVLLLAFLLARYWKYLG
jgi:hypothetical protein